MQSATSPRWMLDTRHQRRSISAASNAPASSLLCSRAVTFSAAVGGALAACKRQLVGKHHRRVQVQRRIFQKAVQVRSKWRRLIEGGFKDTESAEWQRNVTALWDSLLPHIWYLEKQEQRIRCLQAFVVAYKAHEGQKRKSGEDYIVHPVEVAKILAKLNVSEAVLMAGLLHDTVEDNQDISLEDIEDMFGFDVRSMVEGETKASKLSKPGVRHFDELANFVQERLGLKQKGNFEDLSQKKLFTQAENLRDMFMAMADDHRVILIKLADRLHNMRTLEFMKPEKQQNIAMETMHIFVPLAHRFGVWDIKTELEDLCFSYLFPEEFSKLSTMLASKKWQYAHALDAAEEDFQSILAQRFQDMQDEVSWEITGRTKGIYSLWYKMQSRYDGNFDRVHDVVAIRVILDVKRLPGDTPADFDDRSKYCCYRALAAAFAMPRWCSLSSLEDIRYKDYIKIPKPNGYRSLHCFLQHRDMPVPLEVQIRTREMHVVAEYGMAAHYAYKSEQHGEEHQRDLRTHFLASIRRGADPHNPYDFVQDVMKEALGKRCFIMLDGGQVMDLTAGCTVLDAAWRIDVNIGKRMLYAEVNGMPVPLGHKLQNGDQVNIVRAMWDTPTEDWIDIAYLASTKSELRQYFRRKEGTLDLLALVATFFSVAAAVSFLEGLQGMIMRSESETLLSDVRYMLTYAEV
mmetsp:Transcript_12299/g.28799  ORF Transcript_12299/g.28799 Transcript_12299/m.28799 type:complete len:686 (+) Transcript_12299:103-2160(+)